MMWETQEGVDTTVVEEWTGNYGNKHCIMCGEGG